MTEPLTEDAVRRPARGSGPAHDRRAVAQGRRARRFDARLPRQGRRRLARSVVARGGRAGRRAGERPARPRHPQGRHARDSRLDEARMGALRLRRRLRRGDHRRDLREQLAEGLPLHPRALRVDRRARGRRRAAREARGRPAAPTRPDLRRPRRARRTGAGLRGRAPAGARRGGRGDPGGRRLHLHLHLGDDRAAEGVHDLAPQLLRDGGRRRRPGRLHGRGRLDAALPPAGPQLRAAHAPLGPVRRLHDRVLPRSVRGRRRAAHGQADRVPERAPGLREGPRAGAGPVRSGDGRQAAADRLGRRASAVA